MRLGEGVAETAKGREVRALHRAMSHMAMGHEIAIVASAAAFLLAEAAARGDYPATLLHRMVDEAVAAGRVTEG